MKPEIFVSLLKSTGFSPLMGIPCSVFKHLLNYIGDSDQIQNYLCSSEGEAMGLAAGFALSGKLPVVYMQNDGYGNAVNPLSSLQLLYKLPALLLISWRAEPGTKDAPQHQIMGKAILPLLDTFGIPHLILEDDVSKLSNDIATAKDHCTNKSAPFAFIIRRGYFDQYDEVIPQSNDNLTRRMDYITLLTRNADRNDVFLGATGFSGRELYQRVAHKGRFYMMGSMGCLASTGLAIAIEYPERRVFVLDGDGSLLMKMGTLATIGHYQPGNLIHICFDNRGYESTGGQPTASSTTDFPSIARACGYRSVNSVRRVEDFQAILDDIAQYKNPHFIHVEIAPGTDDNLERPSDSPEEMRDSLMGFLK